MTRRQTAKWRAIDFVLLAAVAAAAIWAAQGLSESIAYRWDWPRALSYLLRFEDGEWRAGLLLHGLAATARLFVWGAIFALLFGVALAAARLAAARWARPAAIAYIELMRNIPPLVFMFVFYFFLSAQLPLPDLDAAVESPWLRATLSFCFGDLRLFENFFAGVLCLAAFEGAFVAEVLRGAIQSVSGEQRESARALGLSRLQTARLVVFPQALRRALPPLAGQSVWLIKDSSILSVISIQELTFAGAETAVSSGRIFESWTLVLALYFALCWPLMLGFRKLERGGGTGSGPPPQNG